MASGKPRGYFKHPKSSVWLWIVLEVPGTSKSYFRARISREPVHRGSVTSGRAGGPAAGR
jgi:hypothetical protein